MCGFRACACARVPALPVPCKRSTYHGKVLVRPRVPRLCAFKGDLLGATCMTEPALFTVSVQVHVIVLVRVCGARSRALWTVCECGGLVQYGSWAGAYDNEIACSVLACARVYR